MRRILELLMVALVCTNLAFVNITEAARWAWVAPLVALTLAAPYLARFRRFFVYRPVWNCAVIVVFVLLVHHTLTRGMAHLLEDGLRLSALCQVHLLNNFDRKQKPDLLFFNSFLIAVVTSFLSLDLAYSAIFLVYAPLLVISMQVLALERAGVELAPGLLRRTVLSGLARTGLVLLAAVMVFFLVPRDFQRRGFLGNRFRLEPPGGLMTQDFTEEVSLDRHGVVRASGRVVMRVHLEHGFADQVPTHWRGATLDSFNGRAWTAQRLRVPALHWHREGRQFRRGGLPSGVRLEVELEPSTAARLFAPLRSRRLILDRGSQPQVVMPQPDGTFKYRRAATRSTLRYAVELARPASGGHRISRAQRNQRFAPYLSRVADRGSRKAAELARTIRTGLPPAASEREVVEAMRSHLSTRYEYLAPGVPGAARTLDQFFRQRGAHCEVFATALIVMLRSEGIPCRLATGYRSAEWDDDRRTLTFRALHAHAWVEVLGEDQHWYTVDPTPAADVLLGAARASVWERFQIWASNIWTKITSFNSKSHESAFAWFQALPARIYVRAKEEPLAAFLVVAGITGAILLRRGGRRRRHPPEVRRYRRTLRRLRLEPQPGETPRELLERAVSLPLSVKKLDALLEATVRHERLRYQAA